jgi:hypothetical protein
MRHLLSGTAIAAALAIATPVSAQTPTTSAPSAAAPAAPAMPTQRHKRVPMHHMAKNPGNAATDQLNREELARIGGSGAAPPPPTGVVPGQPSPTTGIPGAGQPSASSHSTPQSPMPPR